MDMYQFWIIRCPRCHNLFISHSNIHSTKCRICNYDFIVNLKKKHFSFRVVAEADSLDEARDIRSKMAQKEIGFKDNLAIKE